MTFYISKEYVAADEFILPAIIGKPESIQHGDAILLMNFRSDRMRQIVAALNDSNFPHFKTEQLNILFTCMTQYSEEFIYPVLFKPEKINNIFPEILAKHNYRQLDQLESIGSDFFFKPSVLFVK